MMDVLIIGFENSAFAKGGRWKEAMDTYREMDVAKVKPNITTFTCLMSACVSGDKWVEAENVFDDMVEAKVDPDNQMFASLLVAARMGAKGREGGRWEQVRLGLQTYFDV